MDLLYSRYASPFSFMNPYIEQGRFGEFVSEITRLEFERKKEEKQKEEDDKLWTAYLLNAPKQSFYDWKNSLKEGIKTESYSMTDEQVSDVKQQARGILSRFSPAKGGEVG